MAARFPRENQSEFPVHCIGTRKLSSLIIVIRIMVFLYALDLVNVTIIIRARRLYVYLYIKAKKQTNKSKREPRMKTNEINIGAECKQVLLSTV